MTDRYGYNQGFFPQDFLFHGPLLYVEASEPDINAPVLQRIDLVEGCKLQ